MTRNPLILHQLAGLAFAGALGGYASSRMPDDDYEGLTPNTQRAIARSQREIVHFTSPKLLSKRARRRARGKSGSAQ